MAVATPARLPVPTCAEIAVASDWKELYRLARFVAKECDAAEDLAEGLSEAANLNETQLDGEINASAHQKRD